MSQAPAQSANPEIQPYFDALRDGRLLIKTCAQRDQRHFYPRVGCPICFSETTEWLESRGIGTIYANSVLRSANELPVLAYVTRHERPTQLSIVDSPADTLTKRAAVCLVVRPGADGTFAPMFTLI